MISTLSSECKIHNLTKNIICMESVCVGKRLCCKMCRQKEHTLHTCKEMGDLDYVIERLGMSKGDEGEIMELVKVASLNTKKFMENCGKFHKMIQNSHALFAAKIISAQVFMAQVLEKKLGVFCGNMAMMNQQSQFQQLVTLLRFLESPQIQNSSDLKRIIQKFNANIEKAIETLKIKIENAFAEFNFETQKCQIKNWQKMSQNQVVGNLEKKDGKKYSSGLFQQQKKQLPEQSDLEKELKWRVEKMFDRIFQIKPVCQPKLENQFQIQSSNKNRRYVLKDKNTTKQIQKALILNKIEKLAYNQNYASSLREFIIEGPNQFDIDCLKRLSETFPLLTKFNYVWNFEEEGLRLEKEQVFFERPRSLEKNTTNFEMSQKLLDIYAQFEQLQNLTINQIQLFTFNENKIKNKKIKHLTIGQYVQSSQQQVLPGCLKKQALNFSGLISLNLFNIKKIDGNFMEQIINQNKATLRNIWMSECIELQDSFYRALSISKIEMLMFDQVKKINHTIVLPESLQTLVLDNCEFHSKTPFLWLDKAVNLKNFSIFDSIFFQATEIGDKIIEDLSSIPDCKIEYLSVAQCKSITNKSLRFIQKMTNLTELCIDNTKICLYKLSQCDNVLSKLTKLAVVGLEVSQASLSQIKGLSSSVNKLTWTFEQIFKKSSQLQLISLRFEEELLEVNLSLFTNLRHISVNMNNTKRYIKKKLVKQFEETIRQRNISINIIPKIKQ